MTFKSSYSSLSSLQPSLSTNEHLFKSITRYFNFLLLFKLLDFSLDVDDVVPNSKVPSATDGPTPLLKKTFFLNCVIVRQTKYYMTLYLKFNFKIKNFFLITYKNLY